MLHRSIPDYPMSTIRQKAIEYAIDDRDIEEGILIATIAQTSLPCHDSTTHMPDSPIGYPFHLLAFHRILPLSSSRNVLPLLDDM